MMPGPAISSGPSLCRANDNGERRKSDLLIRYRELSTRITRKHGGDGFVEGPDLILARGDG
jgi:hypothetical protein